MSKRKSPPGYRARSPPSQVIPNYLSSNTNYPYPYPSKNDLFSSNEESTQEEKISNPINKDYPCFIVESSPNNNVEKAFMKSKKEKQRDDYLYKYSKGFSNSNEAQGSFISRNHLTKSDKNLYGQRNPFKSTNPKHKKINNEKQKYHDYFDNKIYALRGVKSKPKMPFYEKLSDSGDSGGSITSGYSVQSQGGQIKTLALKKYDNIGSKKQFSNDKQGEQLLTFSKYSQVGESRHKFSDNVFRPQYMSPPVLSKDNTHEFNNSQDYVQRRCSPNNDGGNKLPHIVDRILKKNSQNPQNALKNYQPQSELNKKRSSITPNKIQPAHYSPLSRGKKESQNIFSGENVRTDWNKDNTPNKKGYQSKQITSLYTPQYKGHSYHKSDGPFSPQNCYSDKKSKLYEEDNIDHSFLISGSSNLYKSSKKQQAEENYSNNQPYPNVRKRTSHISSVISVEGRCESSRISSISSVLNANEKGQQSSKMKSITLFPITNKNCLQPYDFQLVKKLAQNRRSCTFQVIESSTKTIYCMKKMVLNEQNRKQIALQHKIGVKMNHPNLVRSFCSFYDHKYVYLLMEFMETGTLLQRKLQKHQDISPSRNQAYSPIKTYRATSKDQCYTKQMTQRLRSQQKFQKKHRIVSTLRQCVLSQSKDKGKIIKDILQQILEGVAYLHGRNIWHRDLKPDNIFISHGTYKIGDFGSCSFDNNQDHVGTLDYAAPEIMLKTTYDQSIDIWSLGCIAYELEVGYTPFYDENRSETIRRIVNVEYDEQQIKNRELLNLVKRMLVKNGYLRISAEQALKHEYFKQSHVQSRMRI